MHKVIEQDPYWRTCLDQVVDRKSFQVLLWDLVLASEDARAAFEPVRLDDVLAVLHEAVGAAVGADASDWRKLGYDLLAALYVADEA